MELKVTTWYLDTLSENYRPVDAPDSIRLVKVNPTVEEYRSLYSKTGSDLACVDRMMMSDKQLSSLIHHDNIIIARFLHDDVEMGYGEIFLEDDKNAEIKYFGLYPQSRSKGLGGIFLNKLMGLGFNYVERIWLHTCELDHPSALNTYIKHGFDIYDKNIVLQKVPEDWDLKIRGTSLQYPKSEIISERIHLKRFHPDQHQQFYHLITQNHERLRDYFPNTVESITDLDTARIFLDLRHNDWYLGNSFSYALYLKNENILAGALIIKHIDFKTMRADAGYYLDHKYEGKGYMKEAFNLLIEQARSMNLKTLALRIEPINERSKKLAERCGFMFEKKVLNDFYTLSGEVLDLEYYILGL